MLLHTARRWSSAARPRRELVVREISLTEQLTRKAFQTPATLFLRVLSIIEQVPFRDTDLTRSRLLSLFCFLFGKSVTAAATTTTTTITTPSETYLHDKCYGMLLLHLYVLYKSIVRYLIGRLIGTFALS